MRIILGVDLHLFACILLTFDSKYEHQIFNKKEKTRLLFEAVARRTNEVF